LIAGQIISPLTTARRHHMTAPCNPYHPTPRRRFRTLPSRSQLAVSAAQRHITRQSHCTPCQQRTAGRGIPAHSSSAVHRTPVHLASFLAGISFHRPASHLSPPSQYSAAHGHTRLHHTPLPGASLLAVITLQTDTAHITPPLVCITCQHSPLHAGSPRFSPAIQSTQSRSIP